MSKRYNMEADFDYYIKNQSELVSKYDGKYIIIAEQKVLGAHNTLEEAYKVALKKRKLGEFILQQVGEGRENYSAILSRVEYAAH